mmetsp:Transcript_64016/g.133484  ORF Transcript_64016/g.133484 Transcript_64016/m.133484 type:complete len:247 (-) Transcript_64016:61-801(-)
MGGKAEAPNNTSTAAEPRFPESRTNESGSCTDSVASPPPYDCIPLVLPRKCCSVMPCRLASVVCSTLCSDALARIDTASPLCKVEAVLASTCTITCRMSSIVASDTATSLITNPTLAPFTAPAHDRLRWCAARFAVVMSMATCAHASGMDSTLGAATSSATSRVVPATVSLVWCSGRPTSKETTASVSHTYPASRGARSTAAVSTPSMLLLSALPSSTPAAEADSCWSASKSTVLIRLFTSPGRPL